MRCPECDGETRVIDSRPALGTVRRRRECVACGYRFTTREVSQQDWERLRESVRTAQLQRRLAQSVREIVGALAEMERDGRQDEN